MPIPDSLLPHLEAIYHEVVQAVTTGHADQWGKLGQNAKGDQVKWFDLAADQAVCAYLEGRFPYAVELLSEEGAPRRFGLGRPEWTIILDPVDGSENFSRGLTPTALAIALIPAGQPVAVETVAYALVGDLYNRTVWKAARGQGTYRNGRPVRVSAITRLEQAMLSCDLNQMVIGPGVVAMLAQARAIRVFGSAATVLTRVADGALDAHLDVRGQLTPENFLAPALLLTEAGGILTDPFGQPLPAIQSLTECFSVVAAGTPELHLALLQQLNSGG